MITTTMPKTAAPMASTSKATLQRSLAEAKNYAGWVRAAKALDESNGSDKWKARDRTGLYDYATIRERRDRLRALPTRAVQYLPGGPPARPAPRALPRAGAPTPPSPPHSPS